MEYFFGTLTESDSDADSSLCLTQEENGEVTTSTSSHPWAVQLVLGTSGGSPTSAMRMEAEPSSFRT